MQTSVKLVGSALIALLAVAMFLSTYFTVAQNERVVVSSWGQFSYVAEPGLHFKVPFRDSTTAFRTDILDLAPPKAVNTYTDDNQEVDIVFTVFYRVPTEAKAIEYLYNSNRDYRERLYSLAIDRLKTAMGKVNVQVVAAKRGELRDVIKATLTNDAKLLGIEVTDFQLTDMQFTSSYREAINKAAIQKAQVEQREYARQEAEKEAQRVKAEAIGKADSQREQARGEADARLLNAKASADARLLQATAEARAIQLQGEATAAAIKAQADALKANETLVEMEKAKRWNGQLPTAIYAGAPIPFLTAPAK
jgi:regulator of protease activity HflC (stomatin/prohibitin superfamily)